MAATYETTANRCYTSGADTKSPPRLRLLGCRLERGPAATSRVFVRFADLDRDATVEYRQEGATCLGGDLRLAAIATIEAVLHASNGELRLELVGVKPVRVFDTNLMVVALLAHRGGTTCRVLGTAITDHDQLTGVARATLHAVHELSAPHPPRLDPFE